MISISFIGTLFFIKPANDFSYTYHRTLKVEHFRISGLAQLLPLLPLATNYQLLTSSIKTFPGKSHYGPVLMYDHIFKVIKHSRVSSCLSLSGSLFFTGTCHHHWQVPRYILIKKNMRKRMKNETPYNFTIAHFLFTRHPSPSFTASCLLPPPSHPHHSATVKYQSPQVNLNHDKLEQFYYNDYFKQY